jgi:hypothetical protein
MQSLNAELPTLLLMESAGQSLQASGPILFLKVLLPHKEQVLMSLTTESLITHGGGLLSHVSSFGVILSTQQPLTPPSRVSHPLPPQVPQDAKQQIEFEEWTPVEQVGSAVPQVPAASQFEQSSDVQICWES